MCARPHRSEHLRDISRVIEVLREEAGVANPAADFAWVGVRIFYGTLENV